jgi:hypothetical protein
MNVERISLLRLGESIADITMTATEQDTTPELNLHHHTDYKKYRLQCQEHGIHQELVSEVPTSIFRHIYTQGLYIPYSDDMFDRTNRALESIFASIECLTPIFDACCCRWRLYYGTQMVSNTYIYSSSSEFHTKNYALYELLLEINKKRHNPHISEDNPWGIDPEDDFELDELKPRREFCVADVIIARQPGLNGQDMLSVCFNGIHGSRISFSFISNEIRNNLMATIERTPVVVTNSRLPLLLLAEGTGHVKEEHPHIIRYLMNDLLIKEFCTFIPYRTYI